MNCIGTKVFSIFHKIKTCHSKADTSHAREREFVLLYLHPIQIVNID